MHQISPFNSVTRHGHTPLQARDKTLSQTSRKLAPVGKLALLLAECTKLSQEGDMHGHA